MSEISLLIARKVPAESIQEALPKPPDQKGPGLSYRYYYKRHWTGKMLLCVLYDDHELEDPMLSTLKTLFAEGKIDRIEHDWTTRSGAVHGWFSMHGNWQRTVI